MILASQLRPGMAIRFEGQSYKVLIADYHPGQGKMGGVSHARLRNLETGTLWEHGFRSDLKLEDVPVERRPMEFLYADSDYCYFMDPASFEQVGVPAGLIGEQAAFLHPEMRVPVEFINDTPVTVQLPDVLEARVADTAPPSHQPDDNTWKEARLENGVMVRVPQFLKSGDSIRLDALSLRYMDRVKAQAQKKA
jgi:elongation factor P